MFLDFVYNVALLVAFSVIYALIPHQRLSVLVYEKPVRYRLFSGLLIGCLGIIVMAHALTFAPGIIFDTRSVLLCVAGAIFGPLTAAVAAVMCSAYRFWLGGAGALVGVSVIAESAFFGSLYYYWRLRNPRLNGFAALYLLGLLVHASMLVLMLGIPGGVRFDVMRGVSTPVLLLYPIGVVLLGRIFIQLDTRRSAEHALFCSERNYRELVELAGSIILCWKPDFTITFINEYAVQFFGYPRKDLIGKKILGTILADRDSEGSDLAAMLRAVACNPDEFVENECECRHRDGTALWVSWSNKRIELDSGGYEILSIGIDISRRRRAEQEFARSEERYRRIVETVNEGIWSVDSEFRTTFVNRRLCDMLGYAADEMLGRRPDAFMTPDDVAAHAHGAADCMGSQAGQYERRFARRDGTVLWALVSATPVWQSDGSFAGSLATLTDITDQKQTVLKIQQSEAQFHTLFEHMTQGVFYQNSDGTLSDINPAGLKMLGLSREEFLSRTSYSPAWRVVGEDEAPVPPEQHPSMLALKTGLPVCDRVIGVYNEQAPGFVWFVTNAVPLFLGASAEPTGAFVTFHDITSRLKAQKELLAKEQRVQQLLADSRHSRKVLLSIMEDDRLAHDALHESEERFRSVVETATDAIITVDSNGSIVVWNRAATQVFGYGYDEIIGRSFSQLLPEDIQEQHVVGVLKAFESGVLPSPLNISEVVGLKKDGTEFPAEIAFGVVMQKEVRLITAIVRDITERKLIEQEALRTAQLVSIGELAAGVAHEINNPIMGVINYAQILLNKISKQGGETEIPEKIIKEGTRIAGIVTNLLNFSRSAAENIGAVPVRDIFDPSFQLVQKLFQKAEVKVDVRLDDGLPRVLVRSQKMQQVFINVLSNALYALNVRFPEAHADKIIEIWTEELTESSGAYVRVVFLDHGCGIAPEHLARICNPFFTTKPTGQGTGLGLSISHTLVKEHGGRLLFESEVGQYTRVMVDLPAEKG